MNRMVLPCLLFLLLVLGCTAEKEGPDKGKNPGESVEPAASDKAGGSSLRESVEIPQQEPSSVSVSKETEGSNQKGNAAGVPPKSEALPVAMLKDVLFDTAKELASSSRTKKDWGEIGSALGTTNEWERALEWSRAEVDAKFRIVFLSRTLRTLSDKKGKEAILKELLGKLSRNHEDFLEEETNLDLLAEALIHADASCEELAIPHDLIAEQTKTNEYTCPYFFMSRWVAKLALGGRSECASKILEEKTMKAFPSPEERAKAQGGDFGIEVLDYLMEAYGALKNVSKGKQLLAEAVRIGDEFGNDAPWGPSMESFVKTYALVASYEEAHAVCESEPRCELLGITISGEKAPSLAHRHAKHFRDMEYRAKALLAVAKFFGEAKDVAAFDKVMRELEKVYRKLPTEDETEMTTIITLEDARNQMAQLYADVGNRSAVSKLTNAGAEEPKLDPVGTQLSAWEEVRRTENLEKMEQWVCTQVWIPGIEIAVPELVSLLAKQNDPAGALGWIRLLLSKGSRARSLILLSANLPTGDQPVNSTCQALVQAIKGQPEVRPVGALHPAISAVFASIPCTSDGTTQNNAPRCMSSDLGPYQVETVHHGLFLNRPQSLVVLSNDSKGLVSYHLVDAMMQPPRAETFDHATQSMAGVVESVAQTSGTGGTTWVIFDTEECGETDCYHQIQSAHVEKEGTTPKLVVKALYTYTVVCRDEEDVDLDRCVQQTVLDYRFAKKEASSHAALEVVVRKVIGPVKKGQFIPKEDAEETLTFSL